MYFKGVQNMKKLLSLLLATFMLVATFVPVLAEEAKSSNEKDLLVGAIKLEDAKGSVPLLEEPNEEAKTLWMYYNQTEAVVLEEIDDVWVKVHIGDDIAFLEGYMKKEALVFEEAAKEDIPAVLQKFTVKKDGLWLRNKPEDKAEHRVLNADNKVTVMGYDGMWWHAKVESGEEVLTGFFYYPNAQDKLAIMTEK